MSEKNKRKKGFSWLFLFLSGLWIVHQSYWLALQVEGAYKLSITLPIIVASGLIAIGFLIAFELN